MKRLGLLLCLGGVSALSATLPACFDDDDDAAKKGNAGADAGNEAGKGGAGGTNPDGGGAGADGGDSGTAATNNVFGHLSFDGPAKLVQNGTDIWAVGDFTTVSRAPAPGFAVLDGTGELAACGTGADLNAGFGSAGGVRAIVRVGSSLIIGGGFTTYRGQTVGHLVKIDATTCNVDPTFNPGAGVDGEITSLAVDGNSLYIGGTINTYAGTYVSGQGNDFSGIAKVDATTGALDTAFGGAANPETAGVRTLLVANGALYAGGDFTKWGPANAGWMVKLDPATGALDTTFAGTGFDAAVSALASDGTSLFVGGGFSNYRGAPISRGLAKLALASGDPDATFVAGTGVDGSIYALQLVNGALYIAGAFPTYNGAPAASVAKVDATTGALDAAFANAVGINANADGVVYNINTMVSVGSSIVLGGNFNTFRGSEARNLVKIDAATGAMDATFKGTTHGSVLHGFDAPVYALVANGNGVIAGGDFIIYGGIPAAGAAKIDGTTFEADPAFVADLGKIVPSAAAISGGSLYVGGSLDTGGVLTGEVVKLDASSGAKDAAFTASFGQLTRGAPSDINALTPTTDSLYVGGNFHKLGSTIYAANCIAKLDLATGALDTTFSPADTTPPGANDNGFGASSEVDTIVSIGSDIFVAGGLTTYRGTATGTPLVKLDAATGVRDTGFAPAAGSWPDLRVDGAIAINGALFVSGRPTDATNGVALAKLDPGTGAADPQVKIPTSNFDGALGPRNPFFTGTTLFIGGTGTFSGQQTGGLVKIDPTTGARDTTFGGVALGPTLDTTSSITGVALVGNQLLVTGTIYEAVNLYSLGDGVILDATTGLPISQ